MFRLSQKGEQIQQMFNTIAPTYDFLNHLLSFGIDKRWRTKTVAMLDIPEQGRVLDVATGTGDVALELAKQLPASVAITGADFSAEMVARGEQKIAQSPYRDRINFTVAPCEDLPFPDNHFDGITIAFGIRNVVDRRLGLAELWRVAKPEGQLLILEFSTPRSALFRGLYHLYFKRILPLIGGLFSQYDAYKYLPDSVLEFPTSEQFCETMRSVGFSDVRCIPLTFGIASIYCGRKRS